MNLFGIVRISLTINRIPKVVLTPRERAIKALIRKDTVLENIILFIKLWASRLIYSDSQKKVYQYWLHQSRELNMKRIRTDDCE